METHLLFVLPWWWWQRITIHNFMTTKKFFPTAQPFGSGGKRWLSGADWCQWCQLAVTERHCPHVSCQWMTEADGLWGHWPEPCPDMMNNCDSRGFCPSPGGQELITKPLKWPTSVNYMSCQEQNWIFNYPLRNYGDLVCRALLKLFRRKLKVLYP